MHQQAQEGWRVSSQQLAAAFEKDEVTAEDSFVIPNTTTPVGALLVELGKDSIAEEKKYSSGRAIGRNIMYAGTLLSSFYTVSPQ